MIVLRNAGNRLYAYKYAAHFSFQHLSFGDKFVIKLNSSKVSKVLSAGQYCSGERASGSTHYCLTDNEHARSDVEIANCFRLC